MKARQFKFNGLMGIGMEQVRSVILAQGLSIPVEQLIFEVPQK